MGVALPSGRCAAGRCRGLTGALADTFASVTAEMEREYELMLRELRRESPRGARAIGFRETTA
jgi:hypothetical protein